MNCVDGHVYVYYCDWITPPHDKIALCICARKRFFFWFNTKAHFHHQGQVSIKANEHVAIVRDCCLDLSGLKLVSLDELATARDRGPISNSLRVRILTALGIQISTLPEAHRNLAIANLTP